MLAYVISGLLGILVVGSAFSRAQVFSRHFSFTCFVFYDLQLFCFVIDLHFHHQVIITLGKLYEQHNTL